MFFATAAWKGIFCAGCRCWRCFGVQLESVFIDGRCFLRWQVVFSVRAAGGSCDNAAAAAAAGGNFLRRSAMFLCMG